LKGKTEFEPVGHRDRAGDTERDVSWMVLGADKPNSTVGELINFNTALNS